MYIDIDSHRYTCIQTLTHVHMQTHINIQTCTHTHIMLLSLVQPCSMYRGTTNRFALGDTKQAGDDHPCKYTMIFTHTHTYIYMQTLIYTNMQSLMLLSYPAACLGQ